MAPEEEVPNDFEQVMKEEEQRARIEAENKKREAAEQARLAREISEQAMIELAIAESLKDQGKCSDQVKVIKKWMPK